MNNAYAQQLYLEQLLRNLEAQRHVIDRIYSMRHPANQADYFDQVLRNLEAQRQTIHRIYDLQEAADQPVDELTATPLDEHVYWEQFFSYFDEQREQFLRQQEQNGM